MLQDVVGRTLDPGSDGFHREIVGIVAERVFDFDANLVDAEERESE